jgi:hypothetical protein
MTESLFERVAAALVSRRWFYELVQNAAGRSVVVEIDRMQYETLVSSIRQHCRGRFLYATPDCPEVYFLSGKRNPTRISFDFLRDYGGAETLGRRLDEVHVEAVVLNLHPRFSRRVSPEIRELLASRFPNRKLIGRFILRWRE